MKKTKSEIIKEIFNEVLPSSPHSDASKYFDKLSDHTVEYLQKYLAVVKKLK